MVEERAATYREVFAVAEFRSLFTAHLLSVIGDQFARVALTVLVWQRSGSATLTALTYALTFLPSIVAGPLLSGLADRYPRRRVMVVTDLARAGVLAVMAVPGMPLVVLCLLLVVVQMLAAPFNAARAATLPLVLVGGRYHVGNAVSNIAYQLAQLMGFASGGLLVAGLHPSGALLLDAATFVVSAVLIRVGVLDRPVPADALVRAGWARGIASGAELVWRDARLRMLLALCCLPAFPVVIEGLTVPYSASVGVGTAAVGLLFAAEPAGSTLGMLLINRLAPGRQLRLMRPLAVLSCVVLVACVVEPGLWVTVALWAVSGVCSAYFITANAEFMQIAPDAQRGQVQGLLSTATRASQGVTLLAAGAAADLVPPGVVIAVAGALGAVAAWCAGAGWLQASRRASTTEPLVDRR